MDDINDILDVIDLYKDEYPVWQGAKVKNIFYHIYPSLMLGQCKVHKDEDGVYGYRNWAFLSKEAEQKFLETREINRNDDVYVGFAEASGRRATDRRRIS